jgi:hypothetical protein
MTLFIDYYFKCCMVEQKCKNNNKEEVNEATVQYVGGGFGPPKTESILPIQPFEKNTEMFLFDLQTVGFWV